MNEEFEQVERRGVAPIDVVDDHDQRSAGGARAEQRLDLVVQCRGARRGRFRSRVGERLDRRPPARLPTPALEGSAQRGDPRAERPSDVRLVATSDELDRAVRGRLALRLLDEG